MIEAFASPSTSKGVLLARSFSCSNCFSAPRIEPVTTCKLVLTISKSPNASIDCFTSPVITFNALTRPYISAVDAKNDFLTSSKEIPNLSVLSSDLREASENLFKSSVARLTPLESTSNTNLLISALIHSPFLIY